MVFHHCTMVFSPYVVHFHLHIFWNFQLHIQTSPILHSNSSTLILATFFGINLGSIVIIVFPPLDCGSSSRVLFLSNSSVIFGITRVSTTFLINVDLPVLTAPTTPKYI